MESTATTVPDMLRDLANYIERMLIPFAFNCACGGLEASCARILEDRSMHAQRSTAMRAAQIVRDHALDLEDAEND